MGSVTVGVCVWELCVGSVEVCGECVYRVYVCVGMCGVRVCEDCVRGVRGRVCPPCVRSVCGLCVD